MKNSYDVIVVGGGPAGSRAARMAAEGGASVLVLEKDREIGLPVRCAEGVGEIGLRFISKPDEPKPAWIAHRISGLRTVAPNGDFVDLNHQSGFILNRKLFDYDLAREAADAGAEIVTKAFVDGLTFDDGYVSGVTANVLGKRLTIHSKIIIGADGVESRVGRWAGLRTHFNLHDLETCAQVTAAHVDLDPDRAHFYFGQQLAPGGYVWVFPKGAGMANIGLGISGEYSAEKSAMSYLQQFLDRYFPHVSVLTTVVGGVPCARALNKLVGDGVMLVGDAAHQANPISGGGIIRSIIAGQIAGRVAADALKKNDFSAGALKQYPREWYRGEGKTHNLFYRLKEAIFNLSDEELNQTAKALISIPVEKRTIAEMFKIALINRPRFILDAIKVFL